MRASGLAAIMLLAICTGAARAEPFDAQDLVRRAEALAQSLIGRSAADREVIAPPANIDPKMALVPPRPRGTMQIITPPGSPGGR